VKVNTITRLCFYDWLIVGCLASNTGYIMHIQDENKFSNISKTIQKWRRDEKKKDLSYAIIMALSTHGTQYAPWSGLTTPSATTRRLNNSVGWVLGTATNTERSLKITIILKLRRCTIKNEFIEKNHVITNFDLENYFILILKRAVVFAIVW